MGRVDDLLRAVSRRIRRRSRVGDRAHVPAHGGALLDLAGLSAREIANHLGHEHASMTQDVHMSRHTVSERAAELPVLAQ